MPLKDEQIPFTCKITKKYCGGEIQNLRLDLYKDGEFITPRNLINIPISPDLSEKIDKQLIRKIRQFIIRELKNV